MITTTDIFFESLGIEPLEILGFSSQEELETALIPLMQERRDFMEDYLNIL